MSLINDALKQVSRTKPAASALPLHPVETTSNHAHGSKIVVILLCTLLVIALSFLFRGLSGVRNKTSPTARLRAAARESSQELPEPTHSESNPRPETVPVATHAQPTALPTPPPPAVTATSSGPATGSSVASTQRVGSVTADPPPPPPPFPSLKLQGIFFKPGDGAAMINSRMVRVGDRVQRARILAIERENVSLEWYGETNVLTLR